MRSGKEEERWNTREQYRPCHTPRPTQASDERLLRMMATRNKCISSVSMAPADQEREEKGLKVKCVEFKDGKIENTENREKLPLVFLLM